MLASRTPLPFLAGVIRSFRDPGPKPLRARYSFSAACTTAVTGGAASCRRMYASRLRTPDLAQGFWAAEENDLTRIYRSGWLLRAALKEKLGPCRSFSCRSFRRV